MGSETRSRVGRLRQAKRGPHPRTAGVFSRGRGCLGPQRVLPRHRGGDTGNGWLTVDATWDQSPVDVGHLRLASGGLSAQADLLRVMGQLTLVVVP